MAKELAYEIENVGGVKSVALKLRPGLNILTGKNAIGKTSAMRAIVRAQGGETELECRDGAARGEVRGPGVRLQVGKVVRRTGRAELALADVTPLSTLIDPGYKDTDAAARARIRALIDLLALRVDDASLEKLCQGDADLLGWCRDEIQAECIEDLMEAAEKLRHRAHALAREQKTAESEAEGRGAAALEESRELLDQLGGPPGIVGVSVEAAQQRLVEGSRRYERAVAECEAREVLEGHQNELRATIGDRPDPSPAKADADRAALRAAELAKEIEALTERLAGLRAEREAEVKASQSASYRETELIEGGKRWDEAQEILSREPTGPTRGALPGIEEETVKKPAAALEVARLSASYHQAETRRAEAGKAREIAAREAERIRDLAAAIPAQLGEILADAGAHGLTVIGGRLHAVIDGETFDFERRLSDGQRVSLALDIAAQAYQGTVVPLSGMYWASLDPENRKRFSQLAVERGLYVLSELPASGELRIEHG